MSRRPPGSGSIRKRADGRYEVRVSTGLDPKTGKHGRRSVYARTRKEAREKLTELLHQLDAGTYTQTDVPRISFGQWLTEWLRDYTLNIKPTTLAAYRSCIENHVIPILGKVQLAKLDAATIQQFINAQAEDFAPAMVRNVCTVMKAALHQALRLGYLSVNPMCQVVMPARRRPKIVPLDGDSIPVFLEAISGDPYEDVYRFALFTGMRLSEIIGLTWEQVSLETGIITIDRQLQYISGKYKVSTPKSGRSRSFLLASSVVELLKRVRAKQDSLKGGGRVEQRDGPRVHQ